MAVSPPRRDSRDRRFRGPPQLAHGTLEPAFADPGRHPGAGGCEELVDVARGHVVGLGDPLGPEFRVVQVVHHVPLHPREQCLGAGARIGNLLRAVHAAKQGQQHLCRAFPVRAREPAAARCGSGELGEERGCRPSEPSLARIHPRRGTPGDALGLRPDEPFGNAEYEHLETLRGPQKWKAATYRGTQCHRGEERSCDRPVRYGSCPWSSDTARCTPDRRRRSSAACVPPGAQVLGWTGPRPARPGHRPSGPRRRAPRPIQRASGRSVRRFLPTSSPGARPEEPTGYPVRKSSAHLGCRCRDRSAAQASRCRVWQGRAFRRQKMQSRHSLEDSIRFVLSVRRVTLQCKDAASSRRARLRRMPTSLPGSVAQELPDDI